MDDLTGLLAELEAPPDAVWMRVTANALDPSATHEDLAYLVPDPGDFIVPPADSDEMFVDDLDEDDPDNEPDVWADDVEVSTGDPDDVAVDADLDDLHRDTGGRDQDPDLS